MLENAFHLATEMVSLAAFGPSCSFASSWPFVHVFGILPLTLERQAVTIRFLFLLELAQSDFTSLSLKAFGIGNQTQIWACISSEFMTSLEVPHYQGQSHPKEQFPYHFLCILRSKIVSKTS